MHEMRVLAAQQTHGNSDGYNGQRKQEPHPAVAGEKVDEGADGVVGVSSVQKSCLVQPTHCLLIMRHLNPNAINAILRNNQESGHYDGIAVAEPEAVARIDGAFAPMHRSLFNDNKAVSINNKKD